NNARLLAYVQGGGTLITQYYRVGYEDGSFTPYPLKKKENAERQGRGPENVREPRLLYFEQEDLTRMLEGKPSPGPKIGYIGGEGDKFLTDLQARGVRIRLIFHEEIATGDLKRVDAIVGGAGGY